mmetsp:Transcript_20091/g.9313  ORF Transcript_20091/g.9313 Transcript_20091/m.9313 type:complete len:166 (-) Transcript_20091:383-880(-)|eukprot:CAMPEP_0201285768 /NCGR_PEP_ID=MMETSP1317-20130820/113782_1 /ASSEMBLY_ACC=CAM_ASM_000770 /TAXON_ID=187299 /ORGANISM="Undescribed Undescribed, Strain Undescribed" /LENGTH=165 /DNA_ID=CAMNT_0047611653 /DNA_START=490 /DNA_END=987 /DNA_ORIENTATION=+
MEEIYKQKIQNRLLQSKRLLEKARGKLNPPAHAFSLIAAVIENNKRFVEALLDYCKNNEDRLNRVAAKDQLNRTSLHYGAFNSNFDIVEMLLVAGANPANTDIKGRTALHYAAMNDDRKLIELIFLYSSKKYHQTLPLEHQGTVAGQIVNKKYFKLLNLSYGKST